MKYAFLHKNFRNLSFEKKAIVLSHFFTLVFCFFPWFSATPIYGEDFFYNAFKGPSFLIGFFIFIISFVIVMLFVDRLLEKKKVKLPFSESLLYGVAGIEQIVLLILAWSVLASTGIEYEGGAIRFGIFLTFIAQISGLVATFLFFQVESQKKAKGFFKHPNEEDKSETLIAKNNDNKRR